MSLQKTKIIKDTAFLNIALVISQALAILQSFVIMRFLDPTRYGLWLGLMILLNYGAYVHFGIAYGMVIRLLYYKGQDNLKKIAEMQDTGFTVWTTVSTLFAVGVLAYMFLTSHDSELPKWSIVVIALLLIFEQQILFLTQWQTSYLKDFSLLSVVNILRSVLSFAILVPMAYFKNVTGVMLGSLIVSGIIMCLWWYKTSYRPKILFSYSALKEMLGIGFPILVVILCGALIQNIDRVVILKMLGSVFLGYYGITALGGNAVYGLLAQAGSSIAPHLVEDFARNNDYAPSLLRYLIKPTLIFSYAAVFLISALLLVVPVVVHLALPKYLNGINAFFIMVPGFFFLSIILTANNILNVILMAKKRQYLVVIIQAIAIVIEVGLAVLFIRLGWSIEGVALASTITSAFYGLSILYFASYFVIETNTSRIRFIGAVLIPFLYGVVTLLISGWLGSMFFGRYNIAHCLFQGMVALILYAPLFVYLNKRTHIMKELRPFMNKFLARFSELRKKNRPHEEEIG